MEKGWERTFPYIYITPEIAKILFSGILKESDIKNITLIKEGCRTTNYKVESTFHKSFLLKIFYEKDESYVKEQKLYCKIKNNILMPRIYKINKSAHLDNREYIIYDYLEGQTVGSYIEKGNKLNEEFFIQCANALAEIHNVQYESVGFLNEKLEVIHKLPSLYEWYKLFLRSEAQKKLGCKITNSILNIAHKNKDVLYMLDKNPRLVHGDFQGTNILVNENGQLSGILDWEFCMAGHPIADIGQLFRYGVYDKHIMEVFAEQYSKKSTYTLPYKWYEISRLRDMINIIQILNNKISMPKKEQDLLKILKRDIELLENTK